MNLAKTLVVAGAVLMAAGVMIWLAPRVPFLDRLGRLPGDIRIEGKHGTFYFPWVTCLLVSLVLTLLFQWFGRGR